MNSRNGSLYRIPSNLNFLRLADGLHLKGPPKETPSVSVRSDAVFVVTVVVVVVMILASSIWRPVTFSLALFALLTSCSAQVRVAKGDLFAEESSDEEGTDSEGSTQPEEPQADELYFRLFDPEYDFTRSIENRYEFAKNQFPVVSDVEVAEISGGAILTERLRLIDTAVRSIRIQSLTFWADEGGWEITDRLIAARKRGVDVHIIVDALTNIGLQTQKMYFELQQHDIRIEGFEFGWLSSLSGYGTSDNKWHRARKLNQRFHEKVFIRDGELEDKAIAIVGGSNLAKAYYGIDREDPIHNWRDQDLLLKGKAAVEAANLFDDNLEKFIYHKRTRGVNADRVWDYVLEIAKKRDVEKLVEVSRKDADPLVQAEMQNQIANYQEPTLVKADRIRHLVNRPRLAEFYIQDALLDMIDSSKHSVEIANAYVIPDTDFIEALHNAARRGVKIRILTNSDKSSDLDTFHIIPKASRATYADILEVNAEEDVLGSIEIYEWQGHRELENGIGHMHSKYFIFDDQAVMVGSYNLDPRSLYSNSENVVFALGQEVTAVFQDLFDKDVSSEFSAPVSSETAISYQQPEGFRAKAIDKIIRLLGPLL